MIDHKAGDTLVGEELGDCPFCGRLLATAAPDGLVHALPMCDKFRILPVEDFLSAALAELKKRWS